MYVCVCVCRGTDCFWVFAWDTHKDHRPPSKHQADKCRPGISVYGGLEGVADVRSVDDVSAFTCLTDDWLPIIQWPGRPFNMHTTRNAPACMCVLYLHWLWSAQCHNKRNNEPKGCIRSANIANISVAPSLYMALAHCSSYNQVE